MTQSKKSIEQRLRELVCNQLNVGERQVTRTANFLDDLGADSLDFIELLIATEDEFKVELKHAEIPEAAAEKFQTFGDVLDYLTSQICLPATD